MSSIFEKTSLLAFGLIVSALSTIASDYQLSRLNGTVMPSTGASKTIMIGMPAVKESSSPLYIFLDYNA